MAHLMSADDVGSFVTNAENEHWSLRVLVQRNDNMVQRQEEDPRNGNVVNVVGHREKGNQRLS